MKNRRNTGLREAPCTHSGTGTCPRLACGLAASLLLGFCLLAAHPAQAAKLCAEDEYIGIRTGAYSMSGGEGTDTFIDYYDSDGNLAGRIMDYIDYWESYAILKKGELLETYDNADRILLSTDDFSEVGRFSLEDTFYSVGEMHYVLYDHARNLLLYYDKSGTLICLMRPEDAPPEASDDAWSQIYVSVYEADGYAIVRLQNNLEYDFRAVISDDGMCVTSEEAAFPAAFRRQLRGTMGAYVITEQEGEEREYLLYSKAGELVMRGITQFGGYPDRYYSYHMQGATHFFCRDGDGLLAYDAQLHLVGRLEPEALTSWGEVQYAGDEIIGLPSEKLNGAIVTGGVSYHDTTAAYTRLDGGYLIATEDGFLLLALPQDEELAAVSASFILTEGERGSIVRRRADGTELYVSPRMITIQDDSFLVNRDYEIEEDTYRIYDESANLLYESTRRITACPCGNYYIYRGPYGGIADKNGNWLVKELRFTE